MNKTRKIAFGGLITALGILFIYLGNVLPTNKLYLLGIASSLIPLSILTTGLKNSILVYSATSIMCLLLVGLKGIVLAYIVFFGLYGFIKFYIEKLNKLLWEIPLKLLIFNLALATGLMLSKLFIIAIPQIKYSNYILFILAQIVFLLFDYALTRFISYFHKHYLKRFF